MNTVVPVHTVILAAGSGSHDTRLIVAALIGIAVIIALITFVKLNPFLSLTIGSMLVGGLAGLGLDSTVGSFGDGVGATVASVGTLIALGAIFGKLLADSGGADQLVDTIVGRSSTRTLPWAMALVGMIIGLPMFFEIGLVLLMPVILLVARRSGLPLMRVAIPALAGLSAMHGFVPPHPGPLAAVGALHADLGLTLALGVLVGLPCVIIGGPLFSRLAARWVDVPVPELFLGAAEPGTGRTALEPAAARGRGGPRPSRGADPRPDPACEPSGTRAGAEPGTSRPNTPATGPTAPSRRPDRAGPRRAAAAGSLDLAPAEDRPARPIRRPSFPVTLATVLLPVVLMLAKAVADVVDPNGNGAVKRVLDFLGTPLIALLLAVLLAMYTLGVAAGFGTRAAVGDGGHRAAPDRRHPADRGRRRRLQAGAGGQRDLQGHRVLGERLDHLAAAAGLVRGGADPAGHRLGDGGHGHHRRHPATGDQHPEHLAHLAAGAGDRRRLAVLLARQRRRLLADQAVLRVDACGRTSSAGR